MGSPEPEILRENDLFAGVPLDTLAEFLQKGAHRRFPAEPVLIEENSPAKGIYYIQEGSVLVTKGKGGVEVATLHEGECFGEMSLFGEASPSACVASKTSLEAYFFPEDLVRQYIQGNHAFCLNVLKNMIRRLSDRLRDTTADLLKLRQKTSDGEPV